MEQHKPMKINESGTALCWSKCDNVELVSN